MEKDLASINTRVINNAESVAGLRIKRTRVRGGKERLDYFPRGGMTRSQTAAANHPADTLDLKQNTDLAGGN